MGRIEQCSGTTRAPHEVLPGAILRCRSLFLRSADFGGPGQVKPVVDGQYTAAGTSVKQKKVQLTLELVGHYYCGDGF